MSSCLRCFVLGLVLAAGTAGARTLDDTSPADTKDVPITCANLDGASVFSQEPAPQFLGFFGSSSAVNSIENINSPYGSSQSAL